MRNTSPHLSRFLLFAALVTCLVHLTTVRSTFAQSVINQTPLLVQGEACVGSSVCTVGENFFPGVGLKLKDTVPTFKLEDATAPAGSHANWFLIGNATVGLDSFLIAEQPANSGAITTNPFVIRTGSPDNALVIGPNAVGFGTLNPIGNGKSIHISGGDVASGGATRDVFSGMGPHPNQGPGFNFGYSGFSFGRSSGFFNIRPDASAAAPNPSLRFMTQNVQRMIIDLNGNVGIGQFGAIVGTSPGTSPLSKLHVQGDVRADGNFISNGTTLNVPDYVFEPDYKLLPLKQLAAYIEKEKHLPEIPSATEIKGNGINLSEMQMNLLKKVEELTLYTLQQEDMIQTQVTTISSQSETIEQLHRTNQEQQDAIAALLKRVEALEQRQATSK